MARLFFTRFIKTIMMAAPFLSMTLMLFALWGIAGKTTYADLDPTRHKNSFGTMEAKNYLVNETKPQGQCLTVLDNPEANAQKEKIDSPKEESSPGKIEWDKVV